MKLNCDLGESYGAWQMGNDELIMPYIDMANVACGFHASDPSVMAKTVQLAQSHNVSIGAHPAYPDLQGFGRRNMSMSADEITNLVLYQIGALQAICDALGAKIDYVKPHGALYNTMMVDENVRGAILKALAMLSENAEKTLPLMMLFNSLSSEIKQHASSYSIPVIFEAFADRAYTAEGNLVSRQLEGAILSNDDAIEAHIKGLIQDQEVTSIDGVTIEIVADTICVHGDDLHALESVKKIRQLISSL